MIVLLSLMFNLFLEFQFRLSVLNDNGRRIILGTGTVDLVRNEFLQIDGTAMIIRLYIWRYRCWAASSKFYAFNIRYFLKIRGPVILKLAGQVKLTGRWKNPKQAECIIRRIFLVNHEQGNSP